jgi:SPW repeat
MRQAEAESVPAGPGAAVSTTGEPGRRPRRWQAAALQVLGVLMVVSPYLLHGFRDTPSVLSATLSGVLLLVTGVWARSARNPMPAYAIAMAVGVWLLVAPSLWEFGDGVTTWSLVPLPWDAEPTRAAIARIRWNSVGAGLVALTVVGSVLARLRRRFV